MFPAQVLLMRTPSVAVATDPNFSSVKLLLGFDGPNGSTTITDESGAAQGTATITGATNGAAIETANPKFGTGSLRLDGASDQIKFNDSADWTLGASDWTIEGWFLFDAAEIESNQGLITHYNTTSNQRGWIFDYQGGLATNVLRFAASSTVQAGASASNIVTGNWTPTADTWYHLVAERSGSTWRLYVDGTMLAKATSSITIFDSSASLVIGDTVNTGTEDMKGNVDEVRITIGVARYNSDAGYTVPTAAFPRS